MIVSATLNLGYKSNLSIEEPKKLNKNYSISKKQDIQIKYNNSCPLNAQVCKQIPNFSKQVFNKKITLKMLLAGWRENNT